MLPLPSCFLTTLILFCFYAEIVSSPIAAHPFHALDARTTPSTTVPPPGTFLLSPNLAVSAHTAASSSSPLHLPSDSARIFHLFDSTLYHSPPMTSDAHTECSETPSPAPYTIYTPRTSAATIYSLQLRHTHFSDQSTLFCVLRRLHDANRPGIATGIPSISPPLRGLYPTITLPVNSFHAFCASTHGFFRHLSSTCAATKFHSSSTSLPFSGTSITCRHRASLFDGFSDLVSTVSDDTPLKPSSSCFNSLNTLLSRSLSLPLPLHSPIRSTRSLKYLDVISDCCLLGRGGGAVGEDVLRADGGGGGCNGAVSFIKMKTGESVPLLCVWPKAKPLLVTAEPTTLTYAGSSGGPVYPT